MPAFAGMTQEAAPAHLDLNQRLLYIARTMTTIAIASANRRRRFLAARAFDRM